MLSTIENTKLSAKRLPTNWVPPKKATFREDILHDADVKAAILNHHKQPFLDRKDTERLRNNFKKQICVKMLYEGYHKSFKELNSIFKLQIEDRHRLGPEHPIWDRPLLDAEEDKLTYLCKKLNLAESAERDLNHHSVYSSYQDLAHYFLLKDDAWLSDYFFTKCLMISQNKQARLDSKLEAEAHCNLGLAYERLANDFYASADIVHGSYFQAMNHFQEYYTLTRNKDWPSTQKFDDFTKKDIDRINTIKKANIQENIRNLADEKMFTDACIHLQRIYKIISNKYAKTQEEKIEYLTKAYEVCKSSSIGALEGEASLLLGNAYSDISKLEIAISFYDKYYEISKAENDLENFGKASEALAKCNEKLGNIEKSIEYLKKYLSEVAHNEADKQYARACNCLANIYNSLGKYDTATEYSKKAFDMSRQMNQHDAVEQNRVLYGISRAHKILNLFNQNVELGTKKTINNLLKWKYEPPEATEKILSDL